MTPDRTAALEQAVGKLAEICAMMCDILADIERRGADREQRPLGRAVENRREVTRSKSGQPLLEALENVALRGEVGRLNRVVNCLNRRVESLETQLSAAKETAPPASFEEVIKVTDELFPECSIEIENSSDPDFPEDNYVVFHVELPSRNADDVEGMIERELLWHRRVEAITPEARGKFRILVE